MNENEVVVVGAGPVGLALATELGSQGIAVQVLDAGDGSVAFPAGEAVFSRTMEHLRRWGIADEARREGSPPSDFPHRIVFMTSVTGHLLTAFDNGATNARPGEFAPTHPRARRSCPSSPSCRCSSAPLQRSRASKSPTVRLSWAWSTTTTA